MKHTPGALALITLATLAGLAASGMAHALSGTVTDAKGQPISNVEIEVVGSALQTRTNAAGQFSLDTGDAVVEELHINASGYSHKTLHLESGKLDGLQVALKRSVIEQVDVTALPIHASIMESAQPVTVVSGDDLRRKQAATLGETLKNEVGVHSSYFGPVSSSPIIRGLNGPRVLITQNGLDVSDASRVGPDHVVATEASTAEQIEILRGPATLFYGSGAIGGVVNVVDDRVPSSSEAKGAFSLGHNTVADEDEASMAYTGGNDHVAIHVDGFWRDGGDYDIPGIAVLETEEEHEEEGHEEHRSGVLESSASESKGFNIGGSLLLDNGYVGLSYGRLERVNGIPGHGHAGEDEGEHEGEAHEEVGVVSDFEQNRLQLISELALDTAWLSGVNTRIGYTDYQHAEIEAGAVGTVFGNETLQARVDLILQEFAGWRGALSLEAKTSEFEATGEEAFTPPNKTDSYAIAVMQEKHVGDFLWQLGARVEKVSLEADPIAFGHDEDDLLYFDDLDFDPYSLSAGVVWDFAEDYNLGVSLTHAQRAPSASELFSYGAHIGTNSFEVGALFWLHDGEHPHFHDGNDVEEEVSNNIDISLRKHAGNVGWVVNLFYNKVDNFYYERNTGYTNEDIEGHEHEEEEGHDHEEHEHEHGVLPVYVFEQADATLYGIEAQMAWQFADPFTLTLWGDSIRGKLDDGGNLPRIPPARIGGELRFEQMGWQAEIGVVHYFDQNSNADLETETEGYTLVDAELAYTFSVNASDLTVYLKGSNLTDEEARVHSSFLKNQAPLPGRGISVGLRGTF
ncbi:TonB-dependent receptor [Spongiibacter taiwanensis]|uniref:TonB-dependent receptor n=1 Tax=Spongiibacter taiwanensis TaxID=1748242 RepID=UPI002034AF91|nr:TonB-dependent receptor [Spongiibacter taiwanensis]USA42808.1 TonB-dependent receptor [Spongiibacter taiwanensis]